MEEDSTTCVDAKMMKSDDEEKSMMLEPQNPKKTWQMRRGKLGIENTKDINRFQWCEQHT